MISGCTALIALFVENKIYIANAGDSKCLLSKKSLKESFI